MASALRVGVQKHQSGFPVQFVNHYNCLLSFCVVRGTVYHDCVELIILNLAAYFVLPNCCPELKVMWSLGLWIKLVTVMITFPPPSTSLKSYPLHVRTRHEVTVDQLWSSETRASTLIVDEASVPFLWLHCFCAPFWNLPQEVWGDGLTHISQCRASPLLTLGPFLSCALEDV